MMKPSKPAHQMPKIRIEKPNSPRQAHQKIHEKKKLSRTTQITLSDGKTVTIRYDDLEYIGLLGRGQFGTVNRVYHKETDMYFAAKRINVGTEDEQRGELMDLDVPLKAGDSPYTVKFYGAMFAEGSYIILNECMDTSLDKFYKKVHEEKEKLPEALLSKTAFAVLKALEYLKSKGIMHRDVKPSNILVNRNGEIKLCDFGISGNMNNSRCQTKEKGCRPYMAPEKIDPSMTDGYSVKSDVWSLGISLIEIATNIHPYAFAGDYFSQIKAIFEGEPPKLSPGEFDQDFCDFVNKCLIKSCDSRATIELLLNEPFIQKYTETSLDLEFIERIIKLIEQDNLES